ncbi:hypothetical protein CLV42_107223 [Chitinophaga ginsengisoli]|uniref:Uncharacterized protein n=1 Tax=Chitinophaga ginsengisoli TaxID=363837 RepID=A0A2P8G560_9BACT|nr:hypothetical protein CLV42_107223 [Chitinophaga ginsengisoli]
MKLQLLQLCLSAYALFKALSTGFPVHTEDPDRQPTTPVPIPAGSFQTVDLVPRQIKRHPR